MWWVVAVGQTLTRRRTGLAILSQRSPTPSFISRKVCLSNQHNFFRFVICLCSNAPTVIPQPAPESWLLFYKLLRSVKVGYHCHNLCFFGSDLSWPVLQVLHVFCLEFDAEWPPGDQLCIIVVHFDTLWWHCGPSLCIIVAHLATLWWLLRTTKLCW